MNINMEWLIGIAILVAVLGLGFKLGKQPRKKKLSARRPAGTPSRSLSKSQFDVLKPLNADDHKNSKADVEIRYELKNTLITATELKFLKVLDEVINNRLRVFTMVRVADVISADSSFDWAERKHLFRRVSQKHFDFVICDSKTFEVVCVIELNDESHKQKARKKRDEFLANACESAELPLLFVPVASSYDDAGLKEFIFGSYSAISRKAA